MEDPKVLERMRADWNKRAGEDAYYYVAFGRREQDDEEFFATGSGHREGPGIGPETRSRARCGARNRLRSGPPDAAIEPAFRRDPRRRRLRRDDRSGQGAAARYARMRIPHHSSGSRSFDVPRREIRFRLLLRGVPAHSQRGSGLQLFARGAARAQDRRHPALPDERPAAARQTVRYVERRAHQPEAIRPSRASRTCSCWWWSRSGRSTCGSRAASVRRAGAHRLGPGGWNATRVDSQNQ